MTTTTTTPHLKTRIVTIPVADGTQIPAFLAVPEHKGTMPAVMVFQEIFGVNNHIKAVTKRLAQEGFVAIAPELFHRTAPGFHAVYDDMNAGMQQAKQMRLETTQADLRALHQFLESDPHVKNGCVGAIGFCLGGSIAFLANSLVPLKAAVSYYGGGIASNYLDRVTAQHGPLLTIWGGRDAHIPLAKTRELEDAMHASRKPYTNAIFHDAGHGFLCDERKDYHAASAETAWALSSSFLRTHLHS